MDKSECNQGHGRSIPFSEPPSGATLLPIMATVFVAFLVIGIAIPVLPLHVHQGLGLGTFLVGLVAGTQFAAAILSRVWAGRRADARGPKHTVIAGLAIAAGSGLLYLVSLSLVTRPSISVLHHNRRAELGPSDCHSSKHE
jgi:MFS family permease